MKQKIWIQYNILIIFPAYEYTRGDIPLTKIRFCSAKQHPRHPLPRTSLRFFILLFRRGLKTGSGKRQENDALKTDDETRERFVTKGRNNGAARLRVMDISLLLFHII
jgi:hypothetical protein